MKDFLYLVAGFGVLMAVCYGLFFWCCLAFVVWFAHYMLIGHWQQKRAQRERAARRAAYQAQYVYKPASEYAFDVDFGDNPNAQS